MIYLKDILLETQIAHTQKSLQWVYHGYIAMTPNKVEIITILYLKLLLYFSVKINKENIPTTKARKDPLENVKSKFINEIISKKVFVLFSKLTCFSELKGGPKIKARVISYFFRICG